MKALGWLIRERKVGERRAPSVLDWLVALVLVVIALLEVVAGMFPGPVGVAVAVQVAAILPVAFRRVAPLRAIAVSAAIFDLSATFGVVYGAGGSVAAAGTELLLVYSVGRYTRGRRLLAGAAVALLVALELRGSAGNRHWTTGAYLLILVGGTLGLGVALRVQTERSIALAVAADRAQEEQAAAAQAAVQRSERGSRASCTTWSPTTWG